jgi:bacterioferritin-associated ferredoxin
MKPDDELCVCFHVSCRKVANWIRIHRPRRAGELSQCFGAGTGCGWCRPWLEQLFAGSQPDQATAAAGSPGGRDGDGQNPAVSTDSSRLDELVSRLPEVAEYRQNRKAWRTAKGDPEASADAAVARPEADGGELPEPGDGY